MSYLFRNNAFSKDDDIYDPETEALLRYAEELERENREIEEQYQRERRERELEEQRSNKKRHDSSKYTSNGSFELGFDFKSKKIISRHPKRKRITGIKFGFIPNNGAYIEFETEIV